ncbi:hypothetical protein CC80DRAFT_543810 [Byssothecium circinans]|uniref:Uncharacterized protein n=1 Tax=Byssothecium circinans TaxID=147558 RepID=A0A6A5U961_9PLEO|nr:hypothetical protein CC80DRAFT_543810 [Byssothecium circinans]
MSAQEENLEQMMDKNAEVTADTTTESTAPPPMDNTSATGSSPYREHATTSVETSSSTSIFNFRQTPTALSSWNNNIPTTQDTLQAIIEHPSYPTGLIISDNIPAASFLKLVPGAQHLLYNRQLVIPSSPCLDEDLLAHIIHTFSTAAITGIAKPEVNLGERIDIPTVIRYHCILELFGLERWAGEVLERLWGLCGEVVLRFGDVLWIWETFGQGAGGGGGGGEWEAPHREEYVGMMAWQIVNLDAVGKLEEGIKMAIEMEREPRRFGGMLEERKRAFGLERGMEIPGKKEVAVVENVVAVREERETEQLALSAPDGQPSVQDSGQKSTTAAQYAPELVSTGFSNPLEPLKPDPLAPAFGQPPPKVDVWQSNQGLRATAANQTTAVASTGAGSAGWGFGGQAKKQQQQQQPRAQAHSTAAVVPGTGSVGWGFGGPSKQQQPQTQGQNRIPLTPAPAVSPSAGSFGTWNRQHTPAAGAFGPTSNTPSHQPSTPTPFNSSFDNTSFQPSTPNPAPLFPDPQHSPFTSSSFNRAPGPPQPQHSFPNPPQPSFPPPLQSSFPGAPQSPFPNPQPTFTVFNPNAPPTPSQPNFAFNTNPEIPTNNNTGMNAIPGPLGTPFGPGATNNNTNMNMNMNMNNPPDPFGSSFGLGPTDNAANTAIDTNHFAPNPAPPSEPSNAASGGMARRLAMPKRRRR